MTNADCIRRMNDEQLYDFLSEWECGDIDYSVTFCDLCNEATKRGEVGNVLNLDCDGCRKHWLQRDAVDYGGLMYWKKNITFEDEPQISPADCATCKHDLWSTPRTCGKCARQEDGKPSMYEPKTEPQTERSACDTCQWYNSGIPCGIEPSVCKREVTDIPQTDCPWK